MSPNPGAQLVSALIFEIPNPNSGIPHIFRKPNFRLDGRIPAVTHGTDWRVIRTDQVVETIEPRVNCGGKDKRERQKDGSERLSHARAVFLR
jgi:hypothetical protein